MSARHCTVLYQVPARGVRRLELRRFANRLQEVTQGRPFSCLITSDADLRQWNREFRRQDYATDVLSFPAAADQDGIGEIAISFDRACEQAAERGHAPEDEVRILLLHGVLHLLGFDHETDRGQMARAERRWRRHYQLPAGLIERVRT